MPESKQQLSRSGQRGPVTMAMAEDLRNGGFHELAAIARKYAIDRPRWWHRKRRPA